MDNTLSIIVPVFNRADMVTRCLDSIKAQTWRPLHLIIVDNGSEDDTLDTCQRWIDINATEEFNIDLITESTPGACAARNSGARIAKSDVIMFFDSDDTMRPNLAATAMQGFMKNPDADIVTWKLMFHGINGESYILKHSSQPNVDRQIIHNFMHTPAYAVKRDFFWATGGWDSSLPVWNDWEFGVRLMLMSPRMEYVPNVCADIYAQRQSISGTSFLRKRGQWEQSLFQALTDVDGIGVQQGMNSSEITHHKNMILLKGAYLAADYHREGDSNAAQALIHEVKDLTDTTLHRFMLQLAYRFRSHGGRGLDRILRYLL